eukprot:CAMPEP_0172596628 /NCGR_PEP_ID=MMETSP1068-20121228/16472_1 /TAXON_ID=35684 /ORGANISM="Pseudopedinella elastica, Strain CCMP716" /LENGTH=500 /DNA_ID=CAMNT_0013395769 /DNA_START=89 /DNA_END=1591 /DNA_ORIENTATION=-
MSLARIFLFVKATETFSLHVQPRRRPARLASARRGSSHAGDWADPGCAPSDPPFPSPWETIVVKDRRILVKRDDLFRLPETGLYGNKARKLWSLSRVKALKFPRLVVSHGGAQSNSMLSIAAVVHAKNRELLEKRGGGALEAAAPVTVTAEVEASSRASSVDGDFARQLDLMMAGRTPSPFEGPESEAESEAEYYEEEEEETGRGRGGGERESAQTSLAAPKKFVYFTKTVPRWLRQNPSGNYARALALGAEIRQLSPAAYSDLFASCGGVVSDAPEALRLAKDALWVPQGGACAGAEEGVKLLADEIFEAWSSQGGGQGAAAVVKVRELEKAGGGARQRLAVVLPGGTGATALFLARHLQPRGITVVVVPCVGDLRGAYLWRQMSELDALTGGAGDKMPLLLLDDRGGARPFGEPKAELLEVWRMLERECNLTVDLLYGARAWEVLLSRLDSLPRQLRGRPDRGDFVQLCYLHCGGLEGTSSQLNRYKHAGLFERHQAI